MLLIIYLVLFDVRYFLLSKVSEPSVFEQGDLFRTLIEGIEEAKRGGL